MAENGSTSISDSTLSWLVEVALPKAISDEATRLLKGRAQVIAFFTNDDRKGFRRFFHEKFYEYFLSVTLIEIIGRGETGKVLGRSLFGSSLLETLGDVVVSATTADDIKKFIGACLTLIREYPPVDRTRKNLAAFAIAALSVADLIGEFEVADVDVDEGRFTGTATGGKLKSLVISQFDCRGGDLTSVEFDETTVLTLIADRETLLPNSFPAPTRIRDISQSGGTLTSPQAIDVWIAEHLSNPPEVKVGLIPDELREHEAIKLLMKACRIRQYWLRRGDDLYASRILDNPHWPTLERVLAANNLLRGETRQASGTDATFLHVRNGEDIISENLNNEDVCKMYSDLVQELKSA